MREAWLCTLRMTALHTNIAVCCVTIRRRFRNFHIPWFYNDDNSHTPLYDLSITLHPAAWTWTELPPASCRRFRMNSTFLFQIERNSKCGKGRTDDDLMYIVSSLLGTPFARNRSPFRAPRTLVPSIPRSPENALPRVIRCTNSWYVVNHFGSYVTTAHDHRT